MDKPIHLYTNIG